jgi:diguanylate cyclase (GGDEF)-like protein
MTSAIAIGAGLSVLPALGLAVVVVVQRRVVRELKKLACTESLTGLANRREFTRALDSEIARTSRTGRPFALIMVDVDGLKAINDRWGHRAGDCAIRRVANTLRVACRASDTAARVGGDEFAVVLPETDEVMARELLSRVHALLATHQRAGVVSVSGGVAEFPRDAATAEDLLAFADSELYERKRQPREDSARFELVVPAADARP